MFVITVMHINKNYTFFILESLLRFLERYAVFGDILLVFALIPLEAWHFHDYNIIQMKLFVKKNQFDFSPPIVIDRIRAIVNLLYKAHMIQGEYYSLLMSLLKDGEEAMANNYSAVFDHLGPVMVEKSGDKIVGVVLEMEDVR